MSIEKLIQILAPPMKPVDSSSPELWRRFEKENFQLPNDYKEFISKYGSGQIDWFLTIFNPFSKNEFINLTDQVKEINSGFKELSKDLPTFSKLSLYPEKKGLLPIGNTDNGDYIFWITENEPDSWYIAINPSRSPDIEVQKHGLIDFLVLALEKKIIVDSFPESFPDDVHSFH